MTKRDVEKATAELQGFFEPALKFPARFGGPRSIFAAAVPRQHSAVN
jgi:hypothetical protein